MIKLILFFVTLFWATNCFTQELPETAAGKRAQEIVDLLNRTSQYELEDYIQNHYAPSFRDAFPIAAHKSIFQTTQTMFKKVIVVEIPKFGENEITVVLESQKGDAWLNLNLMVEQEEPHRILSMRLGPGSRPENRKEEKIIVNQNKGESKLENKEETQFSNFDELHQYLLKKSKNNEFSGTVLVAKDGIPTFQKAYGYAYKRFKVPNKIDTKFNLGSINKIFTSVAIAQLMEKGKLSIDDPIGKYLDIFPPEIADNVTIKHLMNMRSGWGDYWDNEYYLSHKDRLRTISDYMDFIKDIHLDFEPGTNFQHCNTGFEVAGAIIEKITGIDYYEYVRENIYKPAGMTNTDSYRRDSPVENLATGYTNMNENSKEDDPFSWENTYIIPPRGTPAGGGYSTAEDMLKFDKALRNHTLLKQEYTNYLLKRFEGSLGDDFVPKRPLLWIGAAPGINAYLGIDFISSYSIIVLSNYDLPSAMVVGKEIVKMLDLE